MVAVSTPGAPTEAGELRRLDARAMGTDVELLGVDVPWTALHEAIDQLDELEGHWSRFRPSSDLCRLNAADGRTLALPAVTLDLIALASSWSRRTDGWFDPTVSAALEAAGYDVSFDEIPSDRPRSDDAPTACPGPDAVVVDLDAGTARLDRGATVDLGGIGKGRAADLIAERWAAEGWSGCANLGGDLRAVGTGPEGAWSAAVQDPFDREVTAAVIGITSGAIATSSTTARTWQRGGLRQHHLIDTHTGRPSTRPPGSVTVVAPTAVEAEVWAKSLLLAGPDAAGLVARCGHACLFIDESGSRMANGMEAFLW